jgi:hypothetical protein
MAKTMTGAQREAVMALLALAKGKRSPKKRSSPVRRSAGKRKRSSSGSGSRSPRYKRMQSLRAAGKW